MKLYVDSDEDFFQLVFSRDWDGWPKQIAPDVYAWYTSEGELASIMIRKLSRLTGGRRIQDLALDFTPPEAEYVEFTPEQTEKLSRKLAEHGITWPAPMTGPGEV